MKHELFPNIVGQDSAKRHLEFYINGYKANGVVPHLMFNAPRGAGKTTLAKAFARNLQRGDMDKPKPFIEINCSSIRSLKQFFNQIVIPHLVDKDATVLFDEASELPRDVTMALLTITNPNKDNRTTFSYDEYVVDFDFSRLTFLFATTEAQKVFHALMDRMERIELEEYRPDELAQIILTGLKDCSVEEGALADISTTLRGNARSAQKMSIKMKSYLDGRGEKNFSIDDWSDFRQMLGILPLGVSKIELQILRCLNERKDTSLTALSAKLGLTKDCLQRDYELYLTKLNLMEISVSGRGITAKGQEYLRKLDV